MNLLAVSVCQFGWFGWFIGELVSCYYYFFMKYLSCIYYGQRVMHNNTDFLEILIGKYQFTWLLYVSKQNFCNDSLFCNDSFRLQYSSIHNNPATTTLTELGYKGHIPPQIPNTKSVPLSPPTFALSFPIIKTEFTEEIGAQRDSLPSHSRFKTSGRWGLSLIELNRAMMVHPAQSSFASICSRTASWTTNNERVLRRRRQ